MSSLTRWDPFREMMLIRRNMDRLFDNYLTEQTGEWEGTVDWRLPLDIVENENEFVVKASLPGINPDDLEITYNEDTLSIKGETKTEEEKEGDRYHVRERRYGSFRRSITLPRGIQADNINANYEAGVLTLHLPKAEEVKPKRIAVRSNEPERMIEGKVADAPSKN